MTKPKTNRLYLLAALLLASLVGPASSFLVSRVSAACPVLPADKGTAHITVNVNSAGSYRVWSRIMAPNANDNSYFIQIDNDICGLVVADSSIPSNAWTWVDYQGGNVSSKINVSLAAGSHEIFMAGREADVKIDRILLLSDATCTPTDKGDNCVTRADTSPPSAPRGLSSPSQTQNSINLTWTASTDNVGVTGYDVYRNNTKISTTTTTSFADQGLSPGTEYDYFVRAKDAVGNQSNSSGSIKVSTLAAPDTTPPSSPTNLTSTAANATTVNLSWTASTDEVGVTGYWIIRNGVTIAHTDGPTSTTYSNAGLSPSTSYEYYVRAHDAAGNVSALSNKSTVTTPALADTQAPTVPTNLTATPASTSQINLTWTASTDNVGVTGYEVYRNDTKVATVSTASFGDSGLTAGTAYNYYVKARDAAGNVSAASSIVAATTQTQTQVTTGSISGIVYSDRGGVISGAKVSVVLNGTRKYYTTSSTGSYYIPALPPATYEVTYNAKLFYRQIFTIKVSSDNTVSKSVTLQSSNRKK